MAEVSPIPKEGDHEQANNNRSISLLPILSKICERVARNKLMPYLVEKKRLSTKQNGNKKWHSTETSLIHTTDAILSDMDNKKATAIVIYPTDTRWYAYIPHDPKHHQFPAAFHKAVSWDLFFLVFTLTTYPPYLMQACSTKCYVDDT